LVFGCSAQEGNGRVVDAENDEKRANERGAAAAAGGGRRAAGGGGGRRAAGGGRRAAGSGGLAAGRRGALRFGVARRVIVDRGARAPGHGRSAAS